MNNNIKYFVFVSYNKEMYQNNDIDIATMSFKEFTEFYQKDNILCLSLTIRDMDTINHDMKGWSEDLDDSVYWFITKETAKECQAFFESFKIMTLINK